MQYHLLFLANLSYILFNS